MPLEITLRILHKYILAGVCAATACGASWGEHLYLKYLGRTELPHKTGTAVP